MNFRFLFTNNLDIRDINNATISLDEVGKVYNVLMGPYINSNVIINYL